MNTAELVIECKKGLGISLETTAFDDTLSQKVRTVQAYMKGAGISDEKMEDDLAVGVIVMGVGDLWEISGGNTRFSSAFKTLMNQLAY
jgi:hypothetical protein